ncbi:MAG: MBL fold metallo-hydrolase [Chloroflexota bacterium]|nr:MBL fold metallo-hydrolase [Chloroflexota bacterium]
MLRERVSNNVYIFTSALYAQVTAGLIVTRDGAILIDSLPFPVEAREIAAFAARVCRPGVRYMILTHYHADHTYGAYLFPQADVVAHVLCRKLLVSRGIPALKDAQAEEPDFEEVILRLPDITFDSGEIGLQLAGRMVRLIHAPGHSPDLVMVYLEDDHVLFAADTVMPVPSIVDGDVDALRASLQKVAELPVENIVQGHGEVILRGEVQGVVQTSLAYLDAIEAKVAAAIKSGKGEENLQRDSIESCGLSRIPLNGLVQQIHVANLLALYSRFMSP